VLPDKPSLDVRWGITTGITRTDPDYLPLAIGTSVLGGSFSARLMSTVRDEEGLTYGIHAYTDGDRLTDGFWQIQATFAPGLLAKGITSTEHELEKWVEEGITKEELEIQKDMQSGVFKVALSTSDGMAGQLLAFLERGYGPERMDEHPQLVRAVKLDEVNDAIRKYIKLDDIVVVKAGTPPTEEEAGQGPAM
jgi:zinc protease